MQRRWPARGHWPLDSRLESRGSKPASRKSLRKSFSGSVARACAPDAGHAAAFGSWSGNTKALLDAHKLRAMLEALPAGVLRAKGVLRLSDAPDRRTVFQRVGKRWSFVADEHPGAPEVSSLVVIGPANAIDATELSRRFDACHT